MVGGNQVVWKWIVKMKETKEVQVRKHYGNAKNQRCRSRIQEQLKKTHGVVVVLVWEVKLVEGLEVVFDAIVEVI